MATKIIIGSHSNTIVIADDEEVPIVEPHSSRVRKTPRRDYSYREFERMIAESVDDETETTLSRKRKRTEAKEPSSLVRVPRKTFFTLINNGQDNAFGKLQTVISYKMQRLREDNRILRDKLLYEREKH